MTFQPLVSIVIPVYNGSNFVREAIESALAQTYKNIEIIVVNDGSNDGGATAAICRSFGDRIRYFEKENGGVSTALNLGISQMRGEYFSWLSHDDLYYPEKIEKQVEYLNRLPEADRSRAFLASEFDLINKGGHWIGASAINSVPGLATNLPAILFKRQLHGCTVLISKSLLLSDECFLEPLRYTQDYDLWIRLLPKSRFICLADYLIAGRVHESQGSHSTNVNQALQKEQERIFERLNQITEKNFAPDDKPSVISLKKYLEKILIRLTSYLLIFLRIDRRNHIQRKLALTFINVSI